MSELTDDAFRAYINDFNTFLHDIGDAPDAGHQTAAVDSSDHLQSEADDIAQACQQKGVNNMASFSGDMDQETPQQINQAYCLSPDEQKDKPTTLDNPNYDDDYYKQSVLEELNDYNNPDWSDLDLTTASDNRLSAISEEKTSEFSCAENNGVSGSWSENRATFEAVDSAQEVTEEAEEEESSVSKSSDEHEISRPEECSSGRKLDDFGDRVFEEQLQTTEKYSYEEQIELGEDDSKEVVEDAKADISASETPNQEQYYQQEETAGVEERDEQESAENLHKHGEYKYVKTGEISGEGHEEKEGVDAVESEANYATEDANESWSNQSQIGSNCEVIDESYPRSPAAEDGNHIHETSDESATMAAHVTTSYNEFDESGDQQNVCRENFNDESGEEMNEAVVDNGNEYQAEYIVENDNQRNSGSTFPVNGNNYEEEEEPADQDNDRTPDDTFDKLRSPSPTPDDHVSLLYSERNKPREQERGRRPRIGRRWEAEMTRGGENVGESTTVQSAGGDDNGGSLPGRGRMKDLLAQWRQLEQQRKDEELLQRTAAVTPTRSRNVTSAVRCLRPRDDNLESPSFRELKATAQMRSQSCGPVVRGRRRQQQDDDQLQEMEGGQGNDAEGQGFDRAAIMAKFENLEAAAQKTTNTTGNRKKDFKWKVRETTTLSRPVGLRIVS